MTHTPMPLAISHDEDGRWLIFSDEDCGGTGNDIALVYNEDDAILYAAAPVMLAALHTIADGEADANHAQHCMRWRRIARKAIAQAEAFTGRVKEQKGGGANG